MDKATRNARILALVVLSMFVLMGLIGVIAR